MCVTAGRIGDEKSLLVKYPLGNSLGAFFIKQWLETFGTLARYRRETRCCIEFMTFALFNNDVADVFEKLGCSVFSVVELEKLGRFVDKLGVTFAGDESRVFQNVRNECNIRLDTADMDFVDGADGLTAYAFKRIIPLCDLDKK